MNIYSTKRVIDLYNDRNHRSTNFFYYRNYRKITTFILF